tara:strand:- start:65 stop:418 length:354 start_codon:yes stop_codon:yes gene_type:complete
MKIEKPFSEYTADELKNYRESGLPVWSAKVGRGSLVYKNRPIYSDLEAPSEKLLDEAIEKMRQTYPDTFIKSKGETVCFDSLDNGEEEEEESSVGPLGSMVDCDYITPITAPPYKGL